MIRHRRLEHRFVKHIPERLEAGILYISMEYATSAHSCCCGCGEEVVAPFTPTDWKMTFDGESISLHPSIGNWTLRCRSHYVVERGEVLEAGPWSEAQVEAVQRRQRAAKARFYTRLPEPTLVVPEQTKAIPGRWLRLREWFIGWK